MKKFILIPLAGLLVFVGYQFLLKVEKISCKTQYGPCPPAIAAEIGKLEGHTVFQIGRELKNLLEGREAVKGYFTQFQLPNKMEVVVDQAKPEFALQYKDQPNTLLIDSEGRVLGIEKSASLPEIISDREPKDAGEKVSPEELFALKVVKDAFFAYNIARGVLEGDTVKLDLGKVYVWFPTRGEKDILLASLKLILAQVEASPELSVLGKRTIDLRFKNPVIK